MSVKTERLETICREINDKYVLNGTPINGVGFDEKDNAVHLYLDYDCKKIVKEVRREYKKEGVRVKDVLIGENW